MKLNRSLAISTKIQECIKGNIIGVLGNEFPELNIDKADGDKSRDRVFTPQNTLLTMVLSAVQQDKSLQNAVDLYYFIHQQNKLDTKKELESIMALQSLSDQQSVKKSAGRPKNYIARLPKSLDKNISHNTAAYSKARSRLPISLTEELFDKSRLNNVNNKYSHFHGYRVLIADGTYLQLQDTESIKAEFEVKEKAKGSGEYPQALLEVITERGTGQLYSFILKNRHSSELALFHDMIDELPVKSLVLADDLYNCFEVIAKCKRKGVELLMPAKRKRNYEVIKVLGKGDEIIRVKTPKKRSNWVEKNEEAQEIIIRRLECKSPDGKDYVLNTTILDENIDKEELQLLYLTRWDIEISIREIKTIMDINILRSKTPEMALKELTVSLATYNLIRKVIHASTESLPFSPSENFIQKFYSLNKDILIDKKGRVYNKWSTGRRRTGGDSQKSKTTKAKA